LVFFIHLQFVLPIDKVNGCHVRFSFKHRATLEGDLVIHLALKGLQ